MDVSPDSSTLLDELNGPESRTLHDLLERLRMLGVGDMVNLPQIVVVGKQSAGKSSVLEAITHVPFPVAYDACTRFATEFVLRRAPTTSVHASIRCTGEPIRPLSLPHTGFSEAILPEIIKNRREEMESTGTRFSKDVLRLEIATPSMYPLSLVDLPGLFTTGTQDQSEHDIPTVVEITERYASEAHSIILVVVATTDQLSHQEALGKIKEIDPTRERTLGVITKPDLAQPGLKGEQGYMSLARNQEDAHRLKLGWHVLRNRAEDERLLDQRDEKERKFFETSAWRQLNAADLGVARLREKLSRALYTSMRRNMPTVVNDIRNNLRRREEELEQLGDPISEPADMKRFLRDLTKRYRRLAEEGVKGRYIDRSFFGELENPQHKLRAQVRNYNRVFDFILKTRGSQRVVVEQEDTETLVIESPEFLDQIVDMYEANSTLPQDITAAEFTAQVRQLAAANQGRELPGSFNHELAIQLFRKEASPWKAIADYHVGTVEKLAELFVKSLVQNIVGSSDANHVNQARADAIWGAFAVPFFQEKHVLLTAKVEELWKPYNDGTYMPLEDEFQSARDAKRRMRWDEAVKGAFGQQPHHGTSDRNDRVIVQRILNMPMFDEGSAENAVFATQEIIDMMNVYYEMSLRTFTDNVINLALESCLLKDIPEVLEKMEANSLSLEELRRLAAEPQSTRERRMCLQEEIRCLREGLQTCEKLWRHETTILPTATRPPPAGVVNERDNTGADGESEAEDASESSNGNYEDGDAEEDAEENDEESEDTPRQVAAPPQFASSVRSGTTYATAREPLAASNTTPSINFNPPLTEAPSATTAGSGRSLFDFGKSSTMSILPGARSSGGRSPSTNTGGGGFSFGTGQSSTTSPWSGTSPSGARTPSATTTGSGTSPFGPSNTSTQPSTNVFGASTPSTTTAGSGSGSFGGFGSSSTSGMPSV